MVPAFLLLWLLLFLLLRTLVSLGGGNSLSLRLISAVGSAIGILDDARFVGGFSEAAPVPVSVVELPGAVDVAFWEETFLLRRAEFDRLSEFGPSFLAALRDSDIFVLCHFSSHLNDLIVY